MIQHLTELRARLIRCGTALAVVFVCCYCFSNKVYSFITTPIQKYLAADLQIITTQVTAPFMVPLQLCFFVSLLLCAPYLLYQLWMFIRPGLYKNERRNIVPLLITSTFLFYCGLAFALIVICPIALKFFTTSAPQGVTVMLDIGSYLDFIITIAIAAGVAFQIPVLTGLLIRCNILSKEQLKAKRRHVIVLTMIIGMLLAPPDVVSQMLLSLPMWALFELGLVLSK